MNGTVGFFEAIKKNNLKIGIVKIKTKNKVTEILKEDAKRLG